MNRSTLHFSFRFILLVAFVVIGALQAQADTYSPGSSISITINASPTTVSSGQPVSLTYSITGGNYQNITHTTAPMSAAYEDYFSPGCYPWGNGDWNANGCNSYTTSPVPGDTNGSWKTSGFAIPAGLTTLSYDTSPVYNGNYLYYAYADNTLGYGGGGPWIPMLLYHNALGTAELPTTAAPLEANSTYQYHNDSTYGKYDYATQTYQSRTSLVEHPTNNTSFYLDACSSGEIAVTGASGIIGGYGSGVCTGAKVDVTVTAAAPAPTATLTANPSTVTQGSPSTLTWGSTNATSCTGTGFSTGNATSGSVSVSPSLTTSYTVSCTGAGGTANASAVVAVTPKPVATLSASPTSITSGGSSTLTYSCSNSTSASINQGVGAVSPVAGGTKTVSPAVTTAYTLTCTGPSGTTNSSPVTVSVVPTLAATCSVSPSSATTGQTVTWKATASGGTGSYTYAWTATGGSPSSGTASSLATSYSTTGTKTATLTVTSGSQTVGPFTCAGDANGGSSVTVTTSQPDLTVTAVPTGTTSFTAGTAETFSGSVSNIGSATATNYPNVLQVLDSAGTTNLGYFAASPATVTTAASSNTSVTGTVPAATAPFNTAGTYKVRYCANMNTSGTNIITESNYGNNCGPTTTVTVTAAALPDLTASSITPTTATQNTPVSLVTTITNIGTAGTSGSFTDQFQKATDAMGTGATNIGTDGNSTALAANGGSTGSTLQNYTFTTAGTWYVRACADSTNVVAESNEGNNCGAWTAVVVSAPAAPAISSCTPSPAVAAPNQSVTWTVSVSGFSPSANSYTWSVTGGTPSSQSGSSATFSSSFTSGGSYAPTVRASNGSQSVGPTSCTPATISGAPYSCSGIPTAVISSNPTRVVSGNSSTITWSATGITTGQSCTITGPNIGGSGVNSITTSVSDSSCNVGGGTATINNITAQSEYTITCTGATAQTAIVNVTPKVQEF